MPAYNLDNDEAVIMQTSGVSIGAFQSVDLILTNKNLIQINKGLLGNAKDTFKYPLSDLKVLNGKANVLIGKSKNGSKQLELYFAGYERFYSFNSGSSENKWANEIIKAHKKRLAEIDSANKSSDGGGVTKTLKGALDVALNIIPIKKETVPKINKCPKCGAELTGPKGTAVTCSYCETQIIIK